MITKMNEHTPEPTICHLCQRTYDDRPLICECKSNAFLRPLAAATPTEFVTDHQWDGLARRLEKKNLKEHGESLTMGSIARHANRFIVDVRPDQKGMIVKIGWRQAMKAAAAVTE